jgi:superfamily II DNA or RNA helicase
VLALTGRRDHIDVLQQALTQRGITPFVLHGKLRKKEREATMAQMEALPADQPRIVLATGRLIGEAFDHPPLDTLVLAAPLSWHGTLKQYAGRLDREHAGKSHLRIVDVVDTGHITLKNWWEKRRACYKSIHYQIKDH